MLLFASLFPLSVFIHFCLSLTVLKTKSNIYVERMGISFVKSFEYICCHLFLGPELTRWALIWPERWREATASSQQTDRRQGRLSRPLCWHSCLIHTICEVSQLTRKSIQRPLVSSWESWLWWCGQCDRDRERDREREMWVLSASSVQCWTCWASEWGWQEI